MTIQECYKEMGGDFEGVQKRFGGVALVEKFAIKFLSDSSFQDLEDGLKEKDAEKAFRAARRDREDGHRGRWYRDEPASVLISSK